MFGKEKEREDYWNFSKDLYTTTYLVIRLLNQSKMIIFGIKKMIKAMKKMITRLKCNHLLIISLDLEIELFYIYYNQLVHLD